MEESVANFHQSSNINSESSSSEEDQVELERSEDGGQKLKIPAARKISPTNQISVIESEGSADDSPGPSSRRDKTTKTSPNVTRTSKKSKDVAQIDTSQDKNQKDLLTEKTNLATLAKLLDKIRFFQERNINS